MFRLFQQYKVLSIIGMGKNVGKTTVLNALLRYCPTHLKIAITSIGFDGEDIDNVTQTPKPKIWANPGTLFATTNYGLDYSTIGYRILETTSIDTALGVVVIGEVTSHGSILLCGPSTKSQTKEVIHAFETYQADHIFIDGAFGKTMSADHYLSDAAILATGASYSANIEKIVAETMYRVHLYDEQLLVQTNSNPTIHHCFESVVGNEVFYAMKVKQGEVVELQGALTDSFIKQLILREDKPKDIILILKNPTMCFVDREWFEKASIRNIQISFKHTTKIVAITINPTAPYGLGVDGKTLQKAIQMVTSIPVMDVMADEE